VQQQLHTFHKLTVIQQRRIQVMCATVQLNFCRPRRHDTSVLVSDTTRLRSYRQRSCDHCAQPVRQAKHAGARTRIPASWRQVYRQCGRDIMQRAGHILSKQAAVLLCTMVNAQTLDANGCGWCVSQAALHVRALSSSSKGGRGSPLKENPKMPSSTTS
jgi:hypothetical protein